MNSIPGKNNVQVLPKDSAKPQAGYLSLHQTTTTNHFNPDHHVMEMGFNHNQQNGVSGAATNSLSLKWTPNR